MKCTIQDGTRTNINCFQKKGYDGEAVMGRASLDRHHSHFILADDDDNTP